MTHDEKLAVIAGNISAAVKSNSRIDDIIEGSLYELALICADAEENVSAPDIAKLIIPRDMPRLLAKFCMIYCRHNKVDHMLTYEADAADHSDSVAIPEIERLSEAATVLINSGISLSVEYGDSFASCAENVQYGDCRYVLIPSYDPVEGMLRLFDKLRTKYGLKVHAEVYIHGEKGEYGYRLCGIGYPDKTVIKPDRLLIYAENVIGTLDYIQAVSEFGASVMWAEMSNENGVGSVRARISIDGLDDDALGGLIMYLSAAADITIDGYFAEIHHKSKGY